MTFLLDENFPKAAASVLRGMEHEVFDVREMGMAGCTDAAVLAKAEELGAVILTTDRDFFHTPKSKRLSPRCNHYRAEKTQSGGYY